MIEKPRHHFSIQLRTVIWNVLPVPGKAWVVVEERDETHRKVSFCAIDYLKKEIVWRNNSLPELWWINLVRATPSQVLLKVFENTSNPDVTRLLALSVENGKPLDQPIEIEDEHTNELIQPFQYLAGEHDFETVQQFVEGRTQKLPLLGVEYLEHAGFIFISFYFGIPGSFTNVLACFTRAGNIVWQVEIGTNLIGIGVNTFFVVADYLFFVKNKSELVTFRIVSALADPSVRREETAVLEALLGIVGKDRLVNGAGRLLEQQRGAWLLGLPVVEKIKLEPGRVWAVASLGGGTPKLAGEIGLSRTRTDGGLALELCTQGRRVGVVRDPGFEVACEAIVSDAELPLTADVQVDTRTKRYGQYLRRCRKAAFGLVAGLCERFEELAGEERAAARRLLLAFAATERQGENARSGARQVAWDAVRAAPLLTDAWGAARTLLEVEAHARAQGQVVCAKATRRRRAFASNGFLPRGSSSATKAIVSVAECCDATLVLTT